MEDISIFSLIIQAGFVVQFVMLFLLLMSIYSWTIIVSKQKYLRNIQLENDDFEENFWAIKDVDSFYKSRATTLKEQGLLANVFVVGYDEFKKNELTNDSSQRAFQAMDNFISRQSREINSNISILAIIASSSPYIGLFGTVWGIMNSFIGLSGVKQATISIVAPGIAEALIATAIGLFVAIPATIAYNRLSTKANDIISQCDFFSNELFVILKR